LTVQLIFAIVDQISSNEHFVGYSPKSTGYKTTCGF